MSGIVTERLRATLPADLARAAALLRDGETVAFPTETVYGLGANALDATAVERIFTAKRRPYWDPLIVHVAERAQLDALCVVSTMAARLMDTFWPGPLTLLLPRSAAVPDAVTAGRPLVGVRQPAHPVAQALLALTGLPIAAPSANLFGHISPTTAAHVLADLDGRIAAVLDGGPCGVGVESTVAGFAGDGNLVIYRPGAVTPAMLEPVAGPVHLYRPAGRATPLEALPSPGVGMRHYAPRARLLLVENAAGVAAGVDEARERGERTGVMLPRGWPAGEGSCVFDWGEWDNDAELARNVYTGLRWLDEQDVDTIVCPLPGKTRTEDGLVAALRDRLRKAAMVPDAEEGL